MPDTIDPFDSTFPLASQLFLRKGKLRGLRKNAETSVEPLHQGPDLLEAATLFRLFATGRVTD